LAVVFVAVVAVTLVDVIYIVILIIRLITTPTPTPTSSRWIQWFTHHSGIIVIFAESAEAWTSSFLVGENPVYDDI
jgi:hypothetical protein